ncbi:MAG: alpha/beta fold hydrolase, partial [Oculatellaceae cyanobacterium bins.114]|nr:alpha/beta fold hydrolase [Oculatellaceae cyanobacterium bins.114]
MLTRKTYVRSLLMTGAMGLTLSACVQPTSGQLPEPGEVPAGLDRFYNQELTFGSCEGFATTATEAQVYVDPFECGRLEVPLDYDEPEGETMQIAVLRLPAQGEPDQRIGSLVLNPGGPGGSGTIQTPFTAVALKETPMVQRFDLVGFDPRGVGASTPAINCFTDEENDRGENQTT